jgi:flagellar biosynthesis/type III secretory pathway protein FliH
MYKETIKLSQPVSCVSSNIGNEKLVELALDKLPEIVKEEIFDEEPVTFEETLGSEVENPNQHNDLLEEQNELLAQIKNLLDGTQESIVHHLVEEKNALEQIFEKIPAIAFQIAEKVINKKINSDRSIIIENLKKSLKSAADTKKLKIAMNPNDIHIVKSSIEEFGMDEATFSKNWELEPNKDIMPGGCLIKTQNEEIDVRIESQLKALEESILKSVSE